MKDEKQGLTAVIDWVQVTFKDIAVSQIMDEILRIDRDLMSFESRGRFRYAGRWKFGGIEVLTPPNDYKEMGYHIYLTGSACRELEIYLRAQKRTWFDFFKICLDYGGNFTRLDIAVDDRKTYFKIMELGEKLGNQECLSRFKNWNFLNGGTISGDNAGCTLNLGSRQSKCSMVFYEKNYEQSKKTGLPVESYGEWNRYEIRLRQEVANNCVEELVKRRNVCFIGLEIINYYVRFVVPSSTNDQKSRWKTWPKWEKFLEDMGQLKLSMKPAPRSVEKIKRWVERQVAPSLKMLQRVDDNLCEDFLKDVIKNAELKKHQEKIVEDYLFSRRDAQKQQEQADKVLEDVEKMREDGFVVFTDLVNPFNS